MQTQKKIYQIVEELIQGYDASSFNQGLMDLGATICRPLNPKCEICPISQFCQAFKINQQRVLPINIKNIKHKELHYITGIITYKDQFMKMCIRDRCYQQPNLHNIKEQQYYLNLTVFAFILHLHFSPIIA